jgi:hypothetical protein
MVLSYENLVNPTLAGRRAGADSHLPATAGIFNWLAHAFFRRGELTILQRAPPHRLLPPNDPAAPRKIVFGKWQ